MTEVGRAIITKVTGAEKMTFIEKKKIYGVKLTSIIMMLIRWSKTYVHDINATRSPMVQSDDVC